MKIKTNQLFLFVKYAVELRKCQHLYLRGNFKQEMFYDKVDMINAWNRIWLSAYATGVQILSVVIMNNHLHIIILVESDEQRTRFKRHLRMSITQYHNRRYRVSGTLGTRSFKHGILKDLDDLQDCICYHIRNVLHHGIQNDFMNYKFSTARYVFNLGDNLQQDVYDCETVPDKLLKSYIPLRESLPEGWKITQEGLIIPPEGVFRGDIIECLFDNNSYIYLDQLSRKTTREVNDRDNNAVELRNSPTLDERVVQFVSKHFPVAIPAMDVDQKMEAIIRVVEEFPNVNKSLLSRLFSIPCSTLSYRINTWRRRNSDSVSESPQNSLKHCRK